MRKATLSILALVFGTACLTSDGDGGSTFRGDDGGGDLSEPDVDPGDGDASTDSSRDTADDAVPDSVDDVERDRPDDRRVYDFDSEYSPDRDVARFDALDDADADAPVTPDVYPDYRPDHWPDYWGSCPDSVGMVLVAPIGASSFCIDTHEASRVDATSGSAGADSSRATSRRGVLPWGNVGLNDARVACTAAGKRLCTADEWFAACAGRLESVYPYSDTYDPDACNGLDAGVGAVSPTGSRLLCETQAGAFDMSGNVAEWVEGGFARGGTYGTGSSPLRCDHVGSEPDLTVPGPVVGFRCCAAIL